MIHITIKYVVSDKGKLKKRRSVLCLKGSTRDFKVLKEAKWSYWKYASIFLHQPERRNSYLFLKDTHLNKNAIIDKEDSFKPLKLYLQQFKQFQCHWI